jgi:hypothetical protein
MQQRLTAHERTAPGTTIEKLDGRSDASAASALRQQRMAIAR